MSDFIRRKVRPEAQAYLRSCESLLALAVAAPHQSFSKDELQLVTYFAAELDKMVSRVRPHPSGERLHMAVRLFKPGDHRNQIAVSGIRASVTAGRSFLISAVHSNRTVLRSAV